MYVHASPHLFFCKIPFSLQLEVSVGNHVSCMRGNPHVALQVATGGQENDLKVWDGQNSDKPVFQAKNVSYTGLVFKEHLPNAPTLFSRTPSLLLLKYVPHMAMA